MGSLHEPIIMCNHNNCDTEGFDVSGVREREREREMEREKGEGGMEEGKRQREGEREGERETKATRDPIAGFLTSIRPTHPYSPLLATSG